MAKPTGSSLKVLRFLLLGAGAALVIRMALLGTERTEPSPEAQEPAATGPESPPSRPQDVIFRVENALCPVMGQAADPKVTGVFEGIEVRFCCPQCDKTLKGAPGKTFRKLLEDPRGGPGLASFLSDKPELRRRLGLEEQRKEEEKNGDGQEPGKRPETPLKVISPLGNGQCPVDAKATGDGVVVTVDGLQVRVCSEPCAELVRKDPRTHLDRLARRDPKAREQMNLHRNLVARKGHGPAYSCPMNCVRSATPGPCPICAMDMSRVRLKEPYALNNPRCPTMGEEIPEDGGVILVYQDLAIRLCCDKCRPTFLQNPPYYLAKIEREQGVPIPRLAKRR